MIITILVSMMAIMAVWPNIENIGLKTRCRLIIVLMFACLASILDIIRHPAGLPSPRCSELRTLEVARACFLHMLPGHRPRNAPPKNLLWSTHATPDMLSLSLPPTMLLRLMTLRRAGVPLAE